MKKNINQSLIYYLIILFLFSTFFLYQKHIVGNDSTISEWLINYAGGFTKRGLIGEICIFTSNILDISLRQSIFFFQILSIAVYFTALYYFFRNISMNKLMLLSIFTPIFILYPVAEIEVLARKEIFIFCIYLLYLNIQNNNYKKLYKIIFLPLSVLIWEPVVFFFPFWFLNDIIEEKINKIDFKFFKIALSFLPSILILFYMALNPINAENHLIMADFLKINFNEICYMSCALLLSKSSIYNQFSANFNAYSFEVFFRYFLIILIGFGPLIILNKFSKIKTKDLIFLRNFNSMVKPAIFVLIPVPLLFAMGYDWGRWVNISYVFSILFYFSLYKKNLITLDNNSVESLCSKFFNNKKIFIFFFIVFCFGWNPKTVVSGDVASFPGYRIPYKMFKIINQNYLNSKNLSIEN